MNALQEQFIAEARELVHQATDDLIAVEREGASSERIDRIFRAFHTLKGSAGIVELPAMTMTLHAAEDLLTGIHRGRLAVSADIVDQALACLDQVSRWVDTFEAQGTLPVQAGDDAKTMTARLQNLLSGTSPRSLPDVAGCPHSRRQRAGAMGLTADRCFPRQDFSPFAAAARRTCRHFLRTARRLFLRWRRSNRLDAAGSQSFGLSRRSTRSMAVAYGSGSIRL